MQADYRRQGVGRRLVEVLRSEAAKVDIHQLFVIAENADEHALEFYRGVGGDPTATTVFGFSRP